MVQVIFISDEESRVGTASAPSEVGSCGYVCNDSIRFRKTSYYGPTCK